MKRNALCLQGQGMLYLVKAGVQADHYVADIHWDNQSCDASEQVIVRCRLSPLKWQRLQLEQGLDLAQAEPLAVQFAATYVSFLERYYGQTPEDHKQCVIIAAELDSLALAKPAPVQLALAV